jgi:hypothetical protein
MPSQSPSASSPGNLTGLFLQPSTPPPSSLPSSSPSSSPSAPETSSPTTDLPTDAWSGESVDSGPSDPGPGENSSPPSTGDLPKDSLAGRGQLAQAAAAGVVMATTAAHEMLADEVGQSVGLYLAEDKEVTAFSDAAAGLVSRRVPPGVGSPDMTDLVTLAFVVGGYVARQFKLKRWVKQLKAAALTAAPADDVDPYAGPGNGV